METAAGRQIPRAGRASHARGQAVGIRRILAAEFVNDGRRPRVVRFTPVAARRCTMTKTGAGPAVLEITAQVERQSRRASRRCAPIRSSATRARRCVYYFAPLGVLVGSVAPGAGDGCWLDRLPRGTNREGVRDPNGYENGKIPAPPVDPGRAGARIGQGELSAALGMNGARDRRRSSQLRHEEEREVTPTWSSSIRNMPL